MFKQEETNRTIHEQLLPIAYKMKKTKVKYECGCTLFFDLSQSAYVNKHDEGYIELLVGGIKLCFKLSFDVEPDKCSLA